MKLVGRAVKTLVVNSELADYIGDRFYNSLAPQRKAYPLAVGRVTGVEPVDSKLHPGLGQACTDMFYYRVTVFAFDPDEAAVIASKFRKVMDRTKRGMVEDIQINLCRMIGAEENGVIEDDADLFVWDLDFEIRVDFSTEDI